MKKIVLIFMMILGVIGVWEGNSYARWHHPWGGPYWGHPWGGPWRPGIYWGGPAIVVDPWPRPYYPPAPPVVVQEPPVYIQQPAPPADKGYWYYCESARAYYPYVKECPSGWMKVVPQPAPPDK